MAHPQALNVRPIDREEATRRLAGVSALDPAGVTSQDSELTKHGDAYEVAGEGGSAVFVVVIRNGCAFVVAAKGAGDFDLTQALDQVVTHGAVSKGCKSIGLQTARRGLVHKLQRRGYRVTGWIMKKDIA